MVRLFVFSNGVVMQSVFDYFPSYTYTQDLTYRALKESFGLILFYLTYANVRKNLFTFKNLGQGSQIYKISDIHRTPREYLIPYEELFHGVKFVIVQNLTSEMT